MSLSGYDSEAVGFDSITKTNIPERDNATQTSEPEFSELETGTQTQLMTECGSTASPEELNAGEDLLRDQPTPGLKEFLNRVVPGMMEQLDLNDAEVYNSSDSDDEEILTAKLYQEIATKSNDQLLEQKATGDYKPASILSMTWSSAGNTIAISLGWTHHEEWCQHDGLIKVYTMKKSEKDQYVHILDINEKNCVTVLSYHSSVAALLAYGTISGEIVLVNMRDYANGSRSDCVLATPQGFHDSMRVTYLRWADAALSNLFLVMQMGSTGKRRGASDRVLVSAGSNGAVNVWQANVDNQVFQNIKSFQLEGSKETPRADVTCFDFTKISPLRPAHERLADDYFVVGTKTGKILICKFRSHKPIVNSAAVDPVVDSLRGHRACVLEVAFSYQKPGLFASVSIDSELRVYDVTQPGALKVVYMDEAISCMCLLPHNPRVFLIGLANVEPRKPMLKVYDVADGAIRVDGMTNRSGDESRSVTALAVNQSGGCRLASGDDSGNLLIWDIPLRRPRLATEDFDF